MIGIIGGSGLYDFPLDSVKHVVVDTPYGATSAPIVVGLYKNSSPVAFLARHGEGHVLNPTIVPYRANIWALKKLGVDRLITVSAVGALKSYFAIGELVLPVQFLDRTSQRKRTFFDEKGFVAHVPMAEPVCKDLRHRIWAVALQQVGGSVREATYLCIEGPQFDSFAESVKNAREADLVGMTLCPEVYLAKEAEMCFAPICVVTDYDCHIHPLSSSVTADVVKKALSEAMASVVSVLQGVIEENPIPVCKCAESLNSAISTDIAHIKYDHGTHGILLDRVINAKKAVCHI
jgi:5'-methylthioadenosine phosphorylase